MGLAVGLVRLEHTLYAGAPGEPGRTTRVEVVRPQRLEFMGQCAHVCIMQYMRQLLQYLRLEGTGGT